MQILRRLTMALAGVLAATVLPLPGRASRAGEPEAQSLEQSFVADIRPLLQRYCQDCHAGESAEAEIDLAAVGGWSEARQQSATWQKVEAILESAQMPPQDAPQPTEVERARLQQWVRDLLTAEAYAQAGDPGPVVLRRLSNAQYTYTLRDLTGVDSLDPAHEFPVDGAAGEGFTNTGNALVMSPSLVTKYLDAAKQVAGHAVLLPDGFRFSPHTTPRDWTNEILGRIREFYGEFTDPRGSDKVNLQGIVFDTNEGGRLPLERYFTATLAARDTLTAGSSVEDVACQHGLNAKYLGLLWSALAGSEPSLLLDDLRARWRTAKPQDAAALAADVAAWQQGLWRFATVGHIGKVGGPKAWLEPVDPLVTSQELRFSIPAPPVGDDVILSLVASDAGDGNAQDFVIWQQPRIVAPGRPDLLLRDVRGVAHTLLASRAELLADTAMFGKHPDGSAIEAASLCVRAPAAIEIRLPAELVAGCELVTTGILDKDTGGEGSVQLAVVTGRPSGEFELLPSQVQVTAAGGQWTADNRKTSYAAPILVQEHSQTRRRIEAAFEEFRQLFPAAICYTKIVPVDEVVTLTLLYREDHHLARLMLDESQQAQLNRLWDELRYVSQDALRLVDAYAQLMEYATQEADPAVFEPLRQPIEARAAAFRQQLIDSQPRHLDALLDFAARAYRRALSAVEAQQLRALYAGLRTEGLSHEDAFRLTLARVLVAPAFLYRIEQPAPGAGPGPVSDVELASRLSYFLWSSLPDEPLREIAAAGQLSDPDTLIQQTRRMLRDAKTRRLATEFACQWLHIYDFDQLDEKSERHFPTFAGLRGAMYEEPIRFFNDLLQNDGSVLDILDADHTFLNEDLAKHYEIPGVAGIQWRRVDGIKAFSRGGILGQGATLAKQSGASRTSPILRGNWISEVLLGERLPRPPAGVPQLPEDETATAGLTVRQLVEKHASDPRCAICHRRIDPLGFSLEAFDAIGRRRDKDLGHRPIDTRVTTMDGATFEGLDGLRNYLLTERREAFLRQFSRKLLGYALGRAVQLSDEPLLAAMQTELAANDFRIMTAIEAIVLSRQFREIRGCEFADHGGS